MHYRIHQRLAVQLVFAAVLPILLVSGAISALLIEGRGEHLK
jgi:hypothetical protein